MNQEWYVNSGKDIKLLKLQYKNNGPTSDLKPIILYKEKNP